MKINVDKSGKFMNLNNDIIIWHGRQQTTVAIVGVDTVATQKERQTGWFRKGNSVYNIAIEKQRKILGTGGSNVMEELESKIISILLILPSYQETNCVVACFFLLICRLAIYMSVCLYFYPNKKE